MALRTFIHWHLHSVAVLQAGVFGVFSPPLLVHSPWVFSPYSAVSVRYRARFRALSGQPTISFGGDLRWSSWLRSWFGYLAWLPNSVPCNVSTDCCFLCVDWGLGRLCRYPPSFSPLIRYLYQGQFSRARQPLCGTEFGSVEVWTDYCRG